MRGLGEFLRALGRWEAGSDKDGVEASAGGVLEEASEVEGLEELSSGGLGFVMDRWVRRRHTSSLLVLLVLLLFLFFSSFFSSSSASSSSGRTTPWAPASLGPPARHARRRLPRYTYRLPPEEERRKKK